jgi:hypothetical protein
MARDILEHHDRIVDDEAGRDGQRHQRQIVEAEAEQVDDAERAEQRHDRRHRRDDGRAQIAQEHADHQHHQHDRRDQRELDVVQRSADRVGAVGGDLQLDAVRNLRLQAGDRAAHCVDGFDDIGAGLLADQHDDRWLAVEQAERALVGHAVLDLGDIAEPDRRVVLPGDDQVAVVGCDAADVVGVDLKMFGVAFDRALGPIRVGRFDRGAHVFQADAITIQRKRHHLDTHRRQRAAADFDFTDAGNLRNFLLQYVGHRFVHPGGRLGLRRQRQHDHRRVGGIGLVVSRVAAQRRGQIGARRVDRGLHFARGAVDVALERKLQIDARAAG